MFLCFRQSRVLNNYVRLLTTWDCSYTVLNVCVNRSDLISWHPFFGGQLWNWVKDFWWGGRGVGWHL